MSPGRDGSVPGAASARAGDGVRNELSGVDEPPLSRPLFTAFRQGLPADRRALIRQALREGTPDTIRIVSTEFLHSFPEYRTEYLPVMKEEALSSLLSRFAETDWSNWDYSRFSLGGGPTPARAYVDLISSVNSELGSYTENVAKQWSVLFTTTRSGAVYEYKIGMGDHRSGVSPASRDISGVVELSEDPVFLSMIERLRARFILGYVQAHQQDPQRSLSLLLSVSAVRDEHITALTALFRRFTLEGSPRFRAEISARLTNPTLLAKLVDASPELRRSLAEFYLMRAIDTLGENDSAAATVLVDESMHLVPDLRGQDIVLRSIGRMKQTAVNPVAPVNASTESARPAEVKAAAPGLSNVAPAPSAAQTGHKEKSWLSGVIQSAMSYLLSTLLVVGLGGGALLLFLYQRSVRSLRPAEHTPPNGSGDNQFRVTAPNDMDFGDESGEDFDLRRSIAA